MPENTPPEGASSDKIESVVSVIVAPLENGKPDRENQTIYYGTLEFYYYQKATNKFGFRFRGDAAISHINLDDFYVGIVLI